MQIYPGHVDLQHHCTMKPGQLPTRSSGAARDIRNPLESSGRTRIVSLQGFLSMSERDVLYKAAGIVSALL